MREPAALPNEGKRGKGDDSDGGNDDSTQLHLMKIVAARSKNDVSRETTGAAQACSYRVEAGTAAGTTTACSPHNSMATETARQPGAGREEGSGDLAIMKVVSERARMALVASIQNEGKEEVAAPVPVQAPTATAMAATSRDPSRKGLVAEEGQLPGAYSAAPGQEITRNQDLRLSLVGGTDPEHATEDEEADQLSVSSFVNVDISSRREEIISQQQHAKEKRIRQKKTLVLGAIGACLVVVGVVIVLVVVLTQEDSSPSTPTESMMAGESPTDAAHSMGGYAKTLFPNTTLEALKVSYSPQSEAYKWLTNDEAYQAGNYSDDRIRQRFALATLYHALGGHRWDRDDYWLNYSMHECQWYNTIIHGLGEQGEWTDEPGRYSSCENDPTNFDPTAPQPSQTLKHLRLANNTLKGNIPPEFYWLTHLHTVDFINNQIEGTLATEIATLTNLSSLGLKNNMLEGTIPSEIASLEHLWWISFSHNEKLTGPVPAEIYTLTSLRGLELPGFASTIPSEVFRMANVWWLKYSDLAGTIPVELAAMTKLAVLDLGTNNRMTGEIPSELALLSSLTELNLEKNSLTGTIPPQLGLLLNVTVLMLDENRLSGRIPSEFGQLTQLKWLRLELNYINGGIPSDLGRLSKLEFLSTHENRVSRDIPTELGLLARVEKLDLSMNALNGTIPSQLGLMSNIAILNLEDNNIHGVIPSELGLVVTLDELNLGSNDLTGSIPTDLEGLVHNDGGALEQLYLDDNGLTGTVPGMLCIGNLTIKFDCSDDLCGCDCPCY